MKGKARSPSKTKAPDYFHARLCPSAVMATTPVRPLTWKGGVSICVGAVAQSASVNLVPGPDFSVGLETIQWPFPQESSTAPVRPHYRITAVVRESM